MSSPAPPPPHAPESVSTGESDGNTTGFRYWRVKDGRLVSPFAGIPLPDNGILTGDCTRPHLPPHPTCLCGVSIYLKPEHVERAVERLDPEQFVITTGITESPITYDNAPQLYYGLAGMPISGPPSHRCRSYRVTRIYTDHHKTFTYDIPIHPAQALFNLLDTSN